MSIERARRHLEKYGLGNRVRELQVSTATTKEAAQALNTEPARIAKTLSFSVRGKNLLIVAAGDGRVNNAKFKAQFGARGSMLPFEDVENIIGHAVGGVCPFGINEGVHVYLDESLRRFETVFPACGSSNSLIELTLAELEQASEFEAWVDVCSYI